ncbi:uncharacterized protein C8Q71DRAFT_267088 [Rhodofomes roseus]|uniref:Uncharacterized protein n=1 Tax=Rhodofomes roseus TaxID=34475 RepID=A0ABQ8K6Q8_9APHY|nr:uncharacterized protein C8Q71DRAFT_267088 [Rhodofomes roseus]KAH9832218.1 hypothetical protein C8Q71DRAFT_267088 [Rhodofomes roseus]
MVQETYFASASSSSDPGARRKTGPATRRVSLLDLDDSEPLLCTAPANGPYHCVRSQATAAVPSPSAKHEPAAEHASCSCPAVPLRQQPRYGPQMLALGSLPATLMLLATFCGRSRGKGLPGASPMHLTAESEHEVLITFEDLSESRQTSLHPSTLSDIPHSSHGYPSCAASPLSRVDCTLATVAEDASRTSSSSTRASSGRTNDASHSPGAPSVSEAPVSHSASLHGAREDDVDAWAHAFRKAFDEVLTSPPPASAARPNAPQTTIEASASTSEQESSRTHSSSTATGRVTLPETPSRSKEPTGLTPRRRDLGTSLARICVLTALFYAVIELGRAFVALIINTYTSSPWAFPSTA